MPAPGQVSRLQQSAEWWRQQRICVTGGRGAIGQCLVQCLLHHGAAHINVFVQKPEISSGRTNQNPSLEHVTGNVLDPDDLDRGLKDCTLVFHFAALVHAGCSQTEAFAYFQVNTLGTASVLEACRRQKVQKVIYASTSHVYGKPQELPVNESHPTVPLSLYAASKLAGEIVARGYASMCDFSCGIARLSNVYGATFSRTTVVGRALRQALSGGPISLRNLSAVRDFIHVNDVVEALVRLGAAGNRDPRVRTVNVSTNWGVSVEEMAETLARIAGEEGLGSTEVLQTGRHEAESVTNLTLDNTRLLELTGWCPQLKLEQGLRLALHKLQELQKKNNLHQSE